jgi:peroxiredoxin Q/BCP
MLTVNAQPDRVGQLAPRPGHPGWKQSVPLDFAITPTSRFTRAMLQEGTKAPPFALPASTGEKVSLKDFAGKKLVLYFYPKDDTPGCTTEAKDFSAAAAKLKKLGASVLGVSKDSVDKHGKFIAKHDLSVTLLSDVDGKVIEAYGAWGEKNMYGKKSMGIVRTTVVIDDKGIVRKVFPKVRVAGHVDLVLEALAEL